MVETVKSQTAERLIAWSLFGLSLLAFAGSLVFEAADCGILINTSKPEPATAYGLLMLPLNAISVSFLGALTIHFQPGNRIGWVCILYGIGFPIGLLGESYGTCSVVHQLGWPGERYAFWLFNVADFTTIGLVLFFWIFPNGQFLSRRWRQVGLLLLTVVIAFSLLSYFLPGPVGELIAIELQIDNPLALSIDPEGFWNDFIYWGDRAVDGLFALLGIFTLLLRWRKSRGVVRQQMKWMTFFLMSAGTVFILVELVGVTVYPAVFDGWFYLIELSIFWLGLPLILGFAVFKFRLYDIDVIIRRTVQYSIVSAVLVLIYFGSVVVLQSLINRTASSQSTLAVVLSTLLIAALFNPLRRRLQTVVDRRFFRQRYDSQQILGQFAQKARDEVEIEVLTAELTRVARETMQPDQISFWLRPTDWKS